MSALLNAGAEVDRQDKNQWTPLMWAMTNRHKEIAKFLLDHGASTDVKSSSGRTAFDFTAPNSEMSDFLQANGYHTADTSVGDDFYYSGLSQDKFEQEMEESEMKRRMMMESSINLEVDLSSLGMDEAPEVCYESCTDHSTTKSHSSRLPRTLMINRNSYGTGVSMTKCSSSRRPNLNQYSTLSSLP